MFKLSVRLVAVALCAIVLKTALPVAAQQQAAAAAVLPPDLVQSVGELSLRGQTRLRVWGFEVYDAALWTTPGASVATLEAQPLALEVRYLRDIKGRDLAERSIREMQRSGALSAEQERRWLDEMLRVFPDVRQGDRLVGLQRPGTGASFWINGRFQGEVRDVEFARRFFGIWLSPQTSEPAMRRALLGLQP
jgi:hypothetical protein